MTDREEYAARRFCTIARVSTHKSGEMFSGLLRDDAGVMYDTSHAHFTTRNRAREAAWSEWRKRCNARNNSPYFTDEPGWDEGR